MAPLAALLHLLLLLLPALLLVAPGATAAGFFQVRRKFPAGRVGVEAAGTNNISAHRAHDGRRLAAADLSLGGLGRPGTGLHFTEIKLGTPPKRYHVAVDTGSDFLQVNCISCRKCPHKSRLQFYDPKASSSGSMVHCNQGLCAVAFGPNLPCTPNVSCPLYSTIFSDGSWTIGFFVTDALHFNKVTGDGQTQAADASISFGAFNYNVNLKSIDVGGTTLQLPAHVFETGAKKGTIIDSGTTLAYLPELVLKEVVDAVFKHQDITFHNVQDFLCFQYSGCVDDGFPTVTFHFEDDLALHVYPHEYFVSNGNDLYCVGFQNSALLDEKDIVVMGDLVLSNKLVVYDLENQVIGWTDYNCSSSIQIKDDKTGTTYAINSHDISTRRKFH